MDAFAGQDVADHMQTLTQLLRPACGGVHVVSTGVREQRALQRALYGAADDGEIDARWRQALASVAGAKAVVLGVPSDAGAGFTRGSNRAPEALRAALMRLREHAYHRSGQVVDAGDVRVIPQLLSDHMLSDAQRDASRLALYGVDADGQPPRLPVSPLDMCALALSRLRALNPSAVPVLLGGDHSLGWPGFMSAYTHLKATQPEARLGVLQLDAHTDLLSERLGVTYCFATWAYHANEVLGRDGRLLQVGLRASAYDRDHWERTLGVRQLWAPEVNSKTGALVAAEAAAHFRALGVTHLYVSHDIDGTDPAYAGATGTPEPNGMHPATVRAIVQRLCARFPLVGADLVEVAPPLTWGQPGEPDRTINVALDYLDDLLNAALAGATSWTP
jgi:arginase family enzyme